MLEEISAAVAFLIRLIEKNTKLSKEQLQLFENKLTELLIRKFYAHWFPDQPNKGQAYRCIRVNERVRRDATLELAAKSCGLKYEDLNLPLELTLWVDPNEVCCRFGEQCGSNCTLASFNGKENKTSLGTKGIGFGTEVKKDVKSEVIPFSASENGVNKTRGPVSQEDPKENSHCPMEWNNQGHLNGGFPPPSLHSWYTLIPQWLSPSPPPPPLPPPLPPLLPPPLPLPPPLFHNRTPTPGNWNNQGSPNYHHWQFHRV